MDYVHFDRVISRHNGCCGSIARLFIHLSGCGAHLMHRQVCFSHEYNAVICPTLIRCLPYHDAFVLARACSFLYALYLVRWIFDFDEGSIDAAKIGDVIRDAAEGV